MAKRKGWLVTQIAPETGWRVEYTYKSRAKEKAAYLRSKGIRAYVRKGRKVPEFMKIINWGVWRKK